jgi:hypothetical protein
VIVTGMALTVLTIQVYAPKLVTHVTPREISDATRV